MHTFPSTIICSSSSDYIDQQLNQIKTDLGLPLSSHHPDIIVIDQNTGWNIDQVRYLKKICQSAPIKAKNRLIIIQQSQNLAPESQNSLLKLIEEPPANNFFLLTTPSLALLLDTIKSRCLIIKHQSAYIDSPNRLKISTSLKSNLDYCQSLGSNKEIIQELIKNQLIFYQKKLISQPSYRLSFRIKLLIKSLDMIEANVNPTSALDFFYLSI